MQTAIESCTKPGIQKGRCKICGIFGFVVKEPSEDSYAQFRKLILASSHRGRDATGFMVVNKKKEIFFHKEPLSADIYVKTELPKFKDIINDGVIIVGHVRAATQGEPVDNKNNHPVESVNWLMVHNGGVYDLPRLSEYKYEGEVDTEVMLSYIEAKGLQEGLPYLGYGSGAIVLINKIDPTYLILARHSNPIHASLNRKGTIFSFASEESILKSVIDPHFCFFTDSQFGAVSEHSAYKVSQKPFEAQCMFTFTVKKAPVSTSYAGYAGKWVSWWNKKDDKKDNKKEDKRDNKKDDIDLPTYTFEVENLVPKEVKDSVKDSYFFFPKEKIWVDRIVNARLVEETGKPTNRYYFEGTAKDFKDWDKIPGSTRGWVSKDRALFKKYDHNLKSHFIMSIQDALMESEVTLIENLSCIVRRNCDIRVFLDSDDQIIGYSLKEEAIDQPLETLSFSSFIDLEGVPTMLLLMYNEKNPSFKEVITRYAVEKFEILEDYILQALLDETTEKLVREAEEGPTTNISDISKGPCVGYVSTIGKDKVMSCYYCMNYNICYSQAGEMLQIG